MLDLAVGALITNGVSLLVASDILITVIIVLQLETLKILGFAILLKYFAGFLGIQSCSIAIRKGCTTL